MLDNKLLAAQPKKKQRPFLRVVKGKLFSKSALDDPNTLSKLEQMMNRAYEDCKNGSFKDLERNDIVLPWHHLPWHHGKNHTP